MFLLHSEGGKEGATRSSGQRDCGRSAQTSKNGENIVIASLYTGACK